METKDTLILPIKGIWYRKILALIKREEYRDIKPFYDSRFLNSDGSFKQFKYVLFINGYGKSRPQAKFECLSISKGKGNPDLGAPDNDVYIIKLGKMIYMSKK